MIRLCIIAIVSSFGILEWKEVSADIIADAVGDYEAGIGPSTLRVLLN